MVVHLTSPNKTYDSLYLSNFANLRVKDDLARLVWPHVRQHALVHDSFFCGAPHLRGVEWRPFPRQRVSAMDFVGNKYDASNAFEGMRLNDTCPQGCRKKMEWRFC